MKKVLKVGFPRNENSAKHETFATLKFEDIEIQFAMSGLERIINGLKSSLGGGFSHLSNGTAKDAAFAFEELHNEMWKFLDKNDN